MKRIIAIFIVLLVGVSPVFSQKKETYRVRTVVIDPGHGGAKPGAQGKRAQEKAITLDVAKKFGKLIEDNYPDVKVIYTRTTDVDISLAERAHIANRNKADLFISIHANSHPTSSPTGVETFVMGLSESRANLEVARKENADILLEADYKNNADYSGFDPNAPETYVMLAMFQNAFIDKSLNLAQTIQNQYKSNLKTINRGVKQAELYVLYKTTCPSVLTEIGFISNPAEEAFMLSDEGQAKIAVCLFNAFMSYKASEEGTAKLSNPVINLKGYGEKPRQEAPKEVEPAPQEAPVVEAPAPAPTVDTVVAPAPVMAAKPDTEVAKAEAPKVEAPKTEEPKVEEPKAEEPKAEVTKAEAPKTEAPVATAPAVKPTPAVALPSVQEKTPEVKPAAQEKKPAATPAAKPAVSSRSGVTYRVQFCTASRQLKAGDSELQGIRDIHYVRNGNYYVYSAGDYTTVQEARQRCKKIKGTTSFHDAFVIAIYKGERITLERAAQIEKSRR